MYGIPKIKFRSSVPWTPASASLAMEGWYDASDADTIIQDDAAGRVSQWSDKSGKGYHLTQVTAAAQLSTGIRNIGGSLNALDGDGTQWVGEDVTLWYPVNADGNISIFAVCVVDSISNFSASVFAMDGTGADFKFAAGTVGDVSGDFNGFVQGGWGTNVGLTGGPFPGPSIYYTEFNKTISGLVTARIDGVSRMSATYVTNLVTTMRFTVLADKGAVQMVNGAVGEVICVHDDLSEATRQKIEGYLAWKWNLVENLSADHPYKSSPTLFRS